MSRIMQLGRTGIGWRAGALFCAVAIALATLAATAAAAGASTAPRDSMGGGPVVVVGGGAVRGTTVGATDQFLGLPYAAPPVGQLRWRPPQPAAHWSGVRDATQYGPHCPQPATFFGLASATEDCLYLNVFTPAGARAGGDHPVMVWIHGGGLWLGESQDYDPTKLVAQGTVVVTINYRLGALGWLAHPALAKRPGGPSGNYGWMDQQAALRWVHRNIRPFGGDPDNVTIAGQSAGGLSVLAQVVSLGARGLFHRAIVQSGAFALKQTPLADAKEAGKDFATKVGCADQTAACLRSLPVSALLMVNPGPFGYVPGVVDGKVLKQSIGPALASGNYSHVPMLNGTTRDEERLFTGLNELFGVRVTAANYQEMIMSRLASAPWGLRHGPVTPAVAAQIAAEYPLEQYPSPPIAYSTAVTDWANACPALKVDKLTSKDVPTFAYEFNDQNAPQRFLPPVSFPYGAYHQSELQYLFDLPTPLTGSSRFPGTLTTEQHTLAASMRHYWANFAARGRPSSAGLPRWPRFNRHSQRMLSLIPPQPQLETGFAAEHHCGSGLRSGSPMQPNKK